jgi:predicted negative regulator of RcsB-dependent stress response
MEVTQVLDPFKSVASASKSNLGIVFIVLAILGAIGYYFYKKNQVELHNASL